MKITISALALAAVFAGLFATNQASAQDVWPSGRTFPASSNQGPPDLSACREAITRGNVLFTQPDGTMIIAFDVLVFAVLITPAGMTCSAVRYIND